MHDANLKYIMNLKKIWKLKKVLQAIFKSVKLHITRILTLVWSDKEKMVDILEKRIGSIM